MQVFIKWEKVFTSKFEFFFLPCQKIRLQVSIEHEFHDSVDRLISCADSKQFNDVPMIKPFHHVSLTEEIQLFLNRWSSLQGFHCNSNLKWRKLDWLRGSRDYASKLLFILASHRRCGKKAREKDDTENESSILKAKKGLVYMFVRKSDKKPDHWGFKGKEKSMWKLSS